MILSNKTIWSCLAMSCIFGAQLSAQQLADMTLNYSNVTASNVNQTVNEIAGNEKEVEFGDYDNDGDIDVVIAVALGDFGQRRNKLYRNDNGVLNEVSGAPVIPGFTFTDTSRSAFFRDYNGDGLLDIIIINDSNSGTATNDAPGRTKLFIQQTDGTFDNVSQDLSGQTGAACNGVSADFDQNGLNDLMMCNYPNISQDSLSLNGINGNAPGQFTVVTNTNYPAENAYGVHAEAADMNGDGLLDILLTNRTCSTSLIYYNNLNGGGSGPGDFRYTGSAQLITGSVPGGCRENAMVPADFDGDGDMDIFFANYNQTGNLTDAILVNNGNGANGFATFQAQEFAPGVTTETHKITCDDLDGDGKMDVIVMDNQSQPRMYRNISSGSDISFVEWTEAIFTTQHDGWQANSADITGNGRVDMLVGAVNGDFLFENSPNTTIPFDSLFLNLVPAIHNSNPVAISGSLDAGETVSMTIAGGPGGVPSAAILSMIARSEADIDVVLRVNGSTVASSARADEGHEGIQFRTAGNNDLVVEVTNNSAGVSLGDINGDGAFNLVDVQPFVNLILNGGFNPAADFNGDGLIDLLDVTGFVDGVLNGGAGSGSAEADFVIEFMSN